MMSSRDRKCSCQNRGRTASGLRRYQPLRHMCEIRPRRGLCLLNSCLDEPLKSTKEAKRLTRRPARTFCSMLGRILAMMFDTGCRSSAASMSAVSGFQALLHWRMMLLHRCGERSILTHWNFGGVADDEGPLVRTFDKAGCLHL